MGFKEELEAKEKKLKLEKDLLEIFPDIQKFSNRWGHKHYRSSSVNLMATDVDFTHSCGCCPDSALYAKFYIMFEGEKIYADPVEISIGEKNEWGGGENIDTDWKETLIKYNINPDLFPEIEKYRIENLSRYDEDDVEE
jgi:hypothetical protein